MAPSAERGRPRVHSRLAFRCVSCTTSLPVGRLPSTLFCGRSAQHNSTTIAQERWGPCPCGRIRSSIMQVEHTNRLASAWLGLASCVNHFCGFRCLSDVGMFTCSQRCRVRAKRNAWNASNRHETPCSLHADDAKRYCTPNASRVGPAFRALSRCLAGTPVNSPRCSTTGPSHGRVFATPPVLTAACDMLATLGGSA